VHHKHKIQYINSRTKTIPMGMYTVGTGWTGKWQLKNPSQEVEIGSLYIRRRDVETGHL